MKKVTAVGIAAAALAALAACEKPPPGVSVFSGTSSERLEPTCFSWDGSIDPQQCLTDAAGRAAAGQTPRLSVAPGTVVGISVDTAIAEQGWYPTIAGQRLSQSTSDSTYFRFTFPEGAPPSEQGYPLTVVSEGEEKGVWVIRLDPEA
jgi:hypothetical protein